MKTEKNLFDLEGRVALIEGACGNIGRALCRGLAAYGADIVAADLNSDDCNVLANDLSSVFPGRYVPAPGDCTTEEGAQSIMKVCDTIGPLHIVIHCIGIISSVQIEGYAVPFEKQTLRAWENGLTTNLTSAFIMAKHIRGRLDNSGKASVIFLSSIYGSLGPDWSLYESDETSNPLAYGVSKGGLQQLMRYLATLWAPVVRVNCISPGGVYQKQSEKFVNLYEKRTPMRRMATTADIVGPVIFLASDAARYITGQNILVDGGWSTW
jgi:NAD(P)-dependent dehydrogenase (short-subunit alcohol dehydrogenase family)